MSTFVWPPLTSSGGGSTAPSAPSGSIQFNNGGFFGGSSALTTDGAGSVTAVSVTAADLLATSLLSTPHLLIQQALPGTRMLEIQQLSGSTSDYVNISSSSGTGTGDVMRIRPNGNVGIGATIPYQNLEVASSSVVPAISLFNNTGGTVGTILMFRSSFSTAAPNLINAEIAGSPDQNAAGGKIVLSTASTGGGQIERIRWDATGITLTSGPVSITSSTSVNASTKLLVGLGHITFDQPFATPTVTVGGPAGTGATASVSANASDQAGIISLTTTAASPGTGPIVTLVNNKAYTRNPSVTLTPGNAVTAAAMSGNQVFVTSSTAGFVINFGVVDAAGHSYVFNYQAWE